MEGFKVGKCYKNLEDPEVLIRIAGEIETVKWGKTFCAECIDTAIDEYEDDGENVFEEEEYELLRENEDEDEDYEVHLIPISNENFGDWEEISEEEFLEDFEDDEEEPNNENYN